MNAQKDKLPHTVKERIEQSKRVHKGIVLRFYLIAWVFVLVAVVVWGRLYWIAGVEGAEWREIERNHRPAKDVVEYPKRGSIYAATGELLRVSVPFFRMRFDFRAEGYTTLCDTNRRKERQVLDTLTQISYRAIPRLHTLDKSRTKETLIQRWLEYSNKGKRGADLYGCNITFEEYKALIGDSLMWVYERKRGSDTLKRTKKRTPYYMALNSDKISTRRAPNGDMAKSALGSVLGRTQDSITVAIGGIEEYYNKYLAGSFGIREEKFRTNRSTTIQKNPPIHGSDVYTTIDWKLQDVAEKALVEQIDHYQAYRGSVAVMEVNTGRIVAISNKERNLKTNKIEESGNHIFIDLMEPGSTLKTASMVIALNDGIIDPKASIDIGNTRVWHYRGRPIQDHNVGVLTYEEVLARSSNIGTAKMIVAGYEHRQADYVNKLKALCFGDSLKSDIPRPSFPTIHSPEKKYWDKLTLSRMSYGYAMQIPPIYILTFYNAIANGGHIMRPYLVDKIVNNRGEVVLENKPTVLRSDIATPHTIDAVRTMLRMVVTDGTAKSLRTPLVAISGKTGTARYTDRGRGYINNEHVVSFCGYFPSENPRYTVYANIVRPQNPKGRPAAALMAGTIVKAVAIADAKRQKQINFEEVRPDAVPSAMPHLLSGRRTSLQRFSQQTGIALYTAEEALPTPYVTVQTSKDRKMAITSITPRRREIMPSVIGMSASDAYYLLLNHGLTVYLKGRGEVVEQSKPSGSKILKGEQVLLYLKPKHLPAPTAIQSDTSTPPKQHE